MDNTEQAKAIRSRLTICKFTACQKIHALPKKPANGEIPAKLIAHNENSRLSLKFHNKN